jgi:hypothetical protein
MQTPYRSNAVHILHFALVLRRHIHSAGKAETIGVVARNVTHLSIQ